ncbi:hypothetical protein pb186bvf_008747 [Paramecium bursaria]
MSKAQDKKPVQPQGKQQAPPPPPPAPPKPKAFDPDEYVTGIHVSRDEVLEVKAAFDLFDHDGSGTIDPNELKAAFEELGFKGEAKFIYQVLAEVDSDNSGQIEFAEFLKLATAKVTDRASRDQVEKVFSIYDWNKEGRITWDELKRVAQDLGEDMTDEQIQIMFKRADRDDDGFVTLEDFYNIVTHKVYWD